MNMNMNMGLDDLDDMEQVIAWQHDYDRIPLHMVESMVAYIVKRRPTGSFLRAIISNNLKEAVMLADHKNIKIIPIYVSWFYNHAPASCWGSSDAYSHWLAEIES